MPIFIWIHGGHFKNGAASFYNGNLIADSEECVVVSIQYRLGAFGFLSNKESVQDIKSL